MAHTTPYQFKMEAVGPPKFDFNDIPDPTLKIVEIKDSIYDFFPSAEIIIDDAGGFVSDIMTIVEGLVFELSLYNENIPLDILKNKYIWSEYQMRETKVGDHIAGRNIFVLISKQLLDNTTTSRAFAKMSTSEIATMIATMDFGITPTFIPASYPLGLIHETINISNTDDKTTWYQFGENHSEFLDSLSNTAFSISAPYSPFYTFINCRGEFYFMHLEDLFLQPSVMKYVMCNTSDDKKADLIHNYNIQFDGVPDNMDNYSVKFFSTDAYTGIPLSEPLPNKLQDHISKMGGGNYLLKRDVALKKPLGWDTENLGIYSIDELPQMYGRQNSRFANSALAYHWEIDVQFNPNLACGKIIELDVPSSVILKGKTIEYCGKWLITDTTHWMDSNHVPITHLGIVKSGIEMALTHPLKLQVDA